MAQTVEKPFRGVPGRRGEALLGLIHPVPSAATVLAGAGFYFIYGGALSLRLVLFLAMVAGHQIGTSIHNDYCDIDLDAAAKPRRALPSGYLRPSAALIAGAIAFGASLVAAAAIGPVVFLLDVAAIYLGVLYNASLKRTVLSWLPFVLAFPLLPLAAAEAAGASPRAWWSLFVVGLPVVLAIHLADSIPDVGSDRAAGVEGLAAWLGRERARLTSLVALAMGVALAGGVALLAGTWWMTIGAMAGAAALAIVLLRPFTHRVAVTAGAAAVALGWVAALASR